MDDVGALNTKWEVGLSSWIIQDGNYVDFESAQRAEFALEFFSQTFLKSGVRRKSAKNLGAASYEICGEVVCLTPEVWVLDFGILAFSERKPPEGIEVGDFVVADIYLGIDPFFYFEYLQSLAGMPSLIYSWVINAICQQTAPCIPIPDPSGRATQVRDASKLGYKTIQKTDAWKDDGGNAEYVLICTRLGEPPNKKRNITT